VVVLPRQLLLLRRRRRRRCRVHLHLVQLKRNSTYEWSKPLNGWNKFVWQGRRLLWPLAGSCTYYEATPT
jgi:hypothetical protein